MELRNLGLSPHKVSPIGLGLAALGRPAYINLGHSQDLNKNYDVKHMEANAHEMLELASAIGINYFDTARSYGKAEEFLGSWLKTQDISKIVIGSKWGYKYTADWKINADHHEIKEHSLNMLRQQWKESQNTLLTSPHIYQIHSATFESGVLENAAVLNELFSLKEQGILIGITVSGDRQGAILEKALTIKINNKLLFDTAQATWNLLETSAGDALKKAHQMGLGVIIKEGVANGRLTEKNNSPAFHEKRSFLQMLAAQNNCSVDTIALAAILHQPWVDVVLSGASTPGQLQANVKALDIKFSDQQISEFSKIKETPEVYWNTRKTLKWN